MKSDDVAASLVTISWDRVKGSEPTNDVFYGLVKLGEHEIKRIKITKNAYAADDCAPCESVAKKIRNEIAKAIRAEYGE